MRIMRTAPILLMISLNWKSVSPRKPKSAPIATNTTVKPRMKKSEWITVARRTVRASATVRSSNDIPVMKVR